MFSKYVNRPIGSYYSHGEDHEIRDLTIGTILSPLCIIREFVPILAVLNLCGVVNIRWSLLVIVYIAYLMIDYLSDLLEIFLKKAARKRTQRNNAIYMKKLREDMDELERKEWAAVNCWDEEEEEETET